MEDVGVRRSSFSDSELGGLRARFRSSNVIPSLSFVKPTIGGSFFITNSHWPVGRLASRNNRSFASYTW